MPPPSAFLTLATACVLTAVPPWRPQVEDALAASGVPLTVLRPGVLMEELYRGSTRAALLQGGSSVLRSLPAASGGRKLQMLAARDLGHVLGHVLSAPDEFKDSALDLAGERAPCCRTFPLSCNTLSVAHRCGAVQPKRRPRRRAQATS